MRVMIAGGGTGGHLFPGIAVAEEVSTRHPKNSVVFVGTNRGLEARVVPAAGFRFESIPSQGLKGKSLLKMLLALLTIPVSLFAAFRVLRRHKPDVVLGVGGYSSGPVVLAAWLLGLPTAVQEQNAVPGLTNRILGRLVKAVFVAFEEAGAPFDHKKVHVIGNPIRRKLLENFLRSNAPHERFSILILGGSLGAVGLNRLVVGALPHLASLANEIEIVHQTGEKDHASVAAAYASSGLKGEARAFIDDMSDAYARADLVICRAGATTVAELGVCKKASILVPFPHATDDHQATNARALVDAGAALMFREHELDGAKLAEQIRALKADPGRLKKMEKAAGLLGRPEAAKEIADVCVDLMLEKWGPSGRTRAETRA